MALLWADGFDHYGGAVARMFDGVYSQLEGVSLSTNRVRTGTHCALINCLANDSGMRRVLKAEKTAIGLAYAFDLTQLPTDAFSLGLLQCLDKYNAQLLTVSVMPTGAITVRQGNRRGTVLAESDPEVVMPLSYQHFEVSIQGSNLEIRINGVTEINMTDLDLSSPIAQVYVGGMYGFPKLGASNVYMRVDDLICRDDEGDDLNTWIGDKKCYLRMPDEDGPDQDWTPSVGSEAWPILDNIPPVDSQYLTATGPGQKVSVGVSAFPGDIVSIAGLYVVARLWKTDAGNAKVSIDVEADGIETDPMPLALTNAPRYYGRPLTINPSTGMPWTVSQLNDANVDLTRTE